MRTAGIATIADIEAIESEAPLCDRVPQASVWHLIEEAANRHASRTALRFLPQGRPDEPAQAWTYGALIDRARQLANALQAVGVQADEGVGCLLPNRPQTYVTLIGCMAGAVACPLSPTLAVEALASLLSAGRCTVLVTDGPALDARLWERACAAAAQAPGLRHVLAVGSAGPGMPPHVQVHDFDAACDAQPAEALHRPAGGRHRSPAARFHTGGTTGAPKLATHSHRNQLHGAWAAARLIGYEADDVVLVGLPLFHVHAVIPLGLAPLSCGAELLLPGPHGYRQPGVIDAFWALLQRHGVSVFSGVPTVYSALLATPGEAPPRLRLALCGSAPLPVAVAEAFSRRTGRPILEGYGLTEGTCVSALNPLRGERRTGSVGLRLPYQQIKAAMLDERGRWQRDAVPGEPGVLLIRGANVFMGYVDPAQDDEAFAAPGWLNTGDIGFIDADGYVHLSGRAKDLIKRSGHSIDPKAVEEALHRHPAVTDAAVVGRPDARAGELPVAYVALKPGARIDPAALLAHCRPLIDDALAQPVALTVLDRLPVTPVGKLDKVRLRELARQASNSSGNNA